MTIEENVTITLIMGEIDHFKHSLYRFYNKTEN